MHQSFTTFDNQLIECYLANLKRNVEGLTYGQVTTDTELSIMNGVLSDQLNYKARQALQQFIAGWMWYHWDLALTVSEWTLDSIWLRWVIFLIAGQRECCWMHKIFLNCKSKEIKEWPEVICLNPVSWLKHFFLLLLVVVLRYFKYFSTTSIFYIVWELSFPESLDDEFISKTKWN